MYRGWLPVQARVRRSYVKPIVDVDSLFVDVEYEYGGRRYVGFELNTMQLATIGYSEEDSVKLLFGTLFGWAIFENMHELKARFDHRHESGETR